MFIRLPTPLQCMTLYRMGKSSLAATAQTYSSEATVHGVSYVFRENSPRFDRILWAISVLTFFILACYLVSNSFSDWQNNLVITTLENTAKDATELEFPAVTICSDGLNFEAMERSLERDHNEWLKNKEKRRKKRATRFEDFLKEVFGTADKRLLFAAVKAMVYEDVQSDIETNFLVQHYVEMLQIPLEGGFKKKRSPYFQFFLPFIDIFFNPERVVEKKEIIKNMEDNFTSFLSMSNMPKLYPGIFRLLWFSSPPCIKNKNMIHRCEWLGKEVECSNLFDMVPTDSGICCAFNKKNALKKSLYANLVAELQLEDKKERNRKKNINDQPAKVRIGKRKGLRVILDQHSNLPSFSTVQQDYHGFKVFIGSKQEFPLVRERSFLVHPGHENYVEATGYVISSDSDIAKLNPKGRNCYFQDEGDLEFHEIYSYASCKLECMIKMVEEEIDCVPWYLPHSDQMAVCNPWKAMEFGRLLDVLDTQICNNRCLPDCNTVIYSFSHSSAPFRFGIFITL